VRDDGKGMSRGRDDSYGISIMKERAQRIDATLEVSSESDADRAPGTVVQVKVAAKRSLTTEGL
jgi:nitrate/nitrite-specific signal transduction histidine kinase